MTRSHSLLIRRTTFTSFLTAAKSLTPAEPSPVGDALVQHGGVHHQQGCDGASVGLPVEVALPEVVQPEVAVEGGA